MEPLMKKPSLFRRAILGLVNGWRRVMDVRYNPLKYIPDPSLQTYFMLFCNVLCVELVQVLNKCWACVIHGWYMGYVGVI